MASKRIDISVNGKDNTAGAFNSTSKNISKLGSEASKAGTTIGSSISKGATTASSALSKTGSIGSKVGGLIGSAMSKGANVASQAVSKLGSTASATFSKISSGASKASSSMDGISGAITGLAGSYGLAEMASDAWTGATQRQFNTAYLGTKMSNDAAKGYIKTINEIVAAVPGDDTFMNTILTGAVAKQTNLTTAELNSLGSAVADYTTVSQAMGKSMIETQMDLKEYVSTGNTSQLERDSILKNQMSTLKDQATVSDRILALNKALTAEGYSGLSALDIASIKWESLKGKVQLAITNIGSALLMIAEPIIEFFSMLDEKTNGASTTIAVLVAGVALLVAAFIGLSPVIVSIGSAMSALGLTSMAALGPIGLAIGAIVLAVAAAIYIWNTWGEEITAVYDKFKAGDWSGAFTDIGASATWLGQQIYLAIAAIPGMIGNISGQMVTIGSQLVQWLIDGFTSLSGSLDTIIANLLTPDAGAMGAAGAASGDYFGKGFVDWINANGPTIINTLVQLFTKLLPLIGQVALKLGQVVLIYLGQALMGLGASLLAWILSPFQGVISSVTNAWNTLKSLVSGGMSGTIGIVHGIISVVWGALSALWNLVKGGADGAIGIAHGIISTVWGAVSSLWNLVRGGAQGSVSVSAFVSDAWNAVSGLYNYVRNGASGVVTTIMKTITGGPSAPPSYAHARGPGGSFDGLALNYENYGGMQKNAINGNNSMSGNCVDMSMGLIAMAGGGNIVQGTWNGNPHVWANIGGKDYDPARKALNGTWSPPPRGPSGDSGGITIVGDVYGFDDFQAKVEKANNKIFRNTF